MENPERISDPVKKGLILLVAWLIPYLLVYPASIVFNEFSEYMVGRIEVWWLDCILGPLAWLLLILALFIPGFILVIISSFDKKTKLGMISILLLNVPILCIISFCMVWVISGSTLIT